MANAASTHDLLLDVSIGQASVAENLQVEDCGSTEILTCDQCKEHSEENEAEGYCEDCTSYLCAPCFKTHLRPKPWRNHRLLNKDEMPMVKSEKVSGDMAPEEEKCSKHGEKVIEYYCENDRLTGCSVCMTMNHRLCNITYIPGESMKMKAEYAELKTEIKSARKDLQDSETKTRSLMKQADKIAVKASNEVAALRNMLVAELDKIQKEFLGQIKTMKQKDNTSLDAFLKFHVQLMNGLADIETKLVEQESGDSPTMAMFMAARNGNEKLKELKQTLKMLVSKNPGITSYQFKSSDTFLNSLKTQAKKFGSFAQGQTEKPETKHVKVPEAAKANPGTQKDTQPKTSTPKEPQQSKTNTPKEPQQSKTNTPKVVDANRATWRNSVPQQLITEINVKADTDKQTCVITGMTVLNNQRLAICDYENCSLKIIDTAENKYKLKLKVNLNSQPYDLAFTGNSIAVTQPYLGQVLLITDMNQFKECKTLILGAECRGIVYQKDKFFVSFNTNPAVIKVMRVDGGLLNVISMVEGEKFQPPFHLAVHTSLPRLYISDCQVKAIEVDGRLIKRHCDIKFQDLRGIAFSTDGNLYVCDWKRNVVYVLFPTGDDNTQVFLDEGQGIKQPLSILATGRKDKKKLYVGQDKCNTIKVFQILKE